MPLKTPSTLKMKKGKSLFENDAGRNKRMQDQVETVLMISQLERGTTQWSYLN